MTSRRSVARLVLGLAALLLVAGGLAAATGWRAAAREAAAEARFPPEGRFVEVEGLRLHLVVAGPADGSVPDLVLIHGASGSARDFTFDLVGRLAGEFRVIVPDRPGFGWSEPAPGRESLDAQARLLAEAAAAVGAERPIVLGHSYGGAVALAWATTMPEHTAALVTVAAPAFPWPDPLPMLYRLTAPAAGQALAVPLIAAWLPEARIEAETAAVFAPQAMPAGYAAHFGPAMSVRRESFRVNARERATLKAEIAAMVPRYRALDLPVEILHGTADPVVGFEIHAVPLAAAVPGAELTALPGIGHMAQHAAPEAVLRALRRAVARAGLR